MLLKKALEKNNFLNFNSLYYLIVRFLEAFLGYLFIYGKSKPSFLRNLIINKKQYLTMKCNKEVLNKIKNQTKNLKKHQTKS
jgi:hypothetical protein